MIPSLQVEAKRDIKLQCDVDRSLASRVDEAAKHYGVPRAAVIRAALQQVLPANKD